LPSLTRSDYLQNSNDSAWMTNPAQPLSGFSPLISRDAQPLGPRTRFANERLASLLQRGKVGIADLQAMVMDNRVYLAEAGGILDDVLQFCSDYSGADAATIGPVCASLRQWDRSANLEAGIGFVHFQNLAKALQNVKDAWRIPFDPGNPVNTPRGLNIGKAAVSEALHQALLVSAQQVNKAGLNERTVWGDIQVSTVGDEQTPVHGGPAALGVYNAMQTVPREDGKREVVSGTSYLQVVGFDEHGPQAQGLLAPSQSSDAQSPHSHDQTAAFAKKQWAVLPFTEAQIKADPAYRLQVVKEDRR
jgi:acyl-homoserine-lactone acylase